MDLILDLILDKSLKAMFSLVSESNQKASTLLFAIPKVLFWAWVRLG